MFALSTLRWYDRYTMERISKIYIDNWHSGPRGKMVTITLNDSTEISTNTWFDETGEYPVQTQANVLEAVRQMVNTNFLGVDESLGGRDEENM